MLHGEIKLGKYKVSRANLLTLLVYVLFAFGAIWHAWPVTRELMLSITPWLLLLINLFILRSEIIFQTKHRKILLGWLAFAFVFTLFLEITGNNWGIPFGNYTYGSVLGPKLLGAPVLIGLNWLIVILSSYYIAGRLFRDVEKNRSQIIIPLATAGLTVIFDILLEPVAISLDYWQWSGGEIPMSNYLSWFGISLILASILKFYSMKLTNKLWAHIYLAQFGFFGLIILLT